MHLKAAAQNIGLDTSTVGWAILEKLVAYNEGDDWNEIWGLITSGKVRRYRPLGLDILFISFSGHIVPSTRAAIRQREGYSSIH